MSNLAAVLFVPFPSVPLPTTLVISYLVIVDASAVVADMSPSVLPIAKLSNLLTLRFPDVTLSNVIAPS